MCQKRDYGCRIVFQLFNKEGKNMKSQMIMRVEDISELGQVHEFLNGCRNYFTRHALIVSQSTSSEVDFSNDTVAVQESSEDEEYTWKQKQETLENSQRL